jgi:acyl dehydratase
LVHSTFFQHIELIDLKALFVGSDRFRVVRPVTANDLVTLRMVIATVESRQEGFRVAYKFEWQGANEADPISNGMFLVRYWPS